jgi:hypothetical protein
MRNQRNRELDGSTMTLSCQSSTLTGTHKSSSLRTHHQGNEVRQLFLEGLLYANGMNTTTKCLYSDRGGGVRL